jgi:Taurine catabolism dioxygenase TauD, TfdA family
MSRLSALNRFCDKSTFQPEAYPHRIARNRRTCVTNPLLTLPPEIQGPSAWYGPEMLTRRDWIEPLSGTEIAEVERATKPLAETRADITSIRRVDFPLPTLGQRLQRILDDTLNGRGFTLIRSLPVERWTKLESAIAFFGIGAHIGAARPQNAKGHALGHVKDLGLSSSDPNTRIYQTRERQTFHTDSCDIVALLCLRPAKSGGLSSLVSSVTIFNEMRRRRPDLAKILFEPVETDRRGEMDAGQKPYFRIPVFNWHDGLLSTIYQRQYIESARRSPDVPPLTARQIEAMDMFDALANDPALNMHMEFRPGDAQLVHNHTILHDRTAFEDWLEPERKRHLLRLWLAPANARPLPPVFAERYGRITPGERGGVTPPGIKLTAPLDAE